MANAAATFPVLNIGVRDGRVVAARGARVAVPRTPRRELDAGGMWVVPGGIDSHVHFNLDVTEAMKAQSAIDGSRAGAFGGTTTFVDFALQSGDGSAVEAVQREGRGQLAGQRPNVDYALHVMLTGARSPFAVMDELPDLVSGGIPSVKMFTTFSAGSASGDLYSDDGRIWGVMQAASAAGGGGDGALRGRLRHRLQRPPALRGRSGRPVPNIAEARPPLAEEAAIRRMIVLAQRSGCPLYVVHVSSSAGVSTRSAEARDRRLPVYGEVLHNYLAFTNDRGRLAEDGLLYHNYPPLKSTDDQAALGSHRARRPRDGRLRRLHHPQGGQAIRPGRGHRARRAQRHRDPDGRPLLRRRRLRTAGDPAVRPG